MENYKIVNPEYIDLEKTRVRFTLVYDSGISSIAELQVPPNKERDVNPYWDKIMDEFDIEKMRRDRNDLEIERQRLMEFEDKKRKSAIENESLRQLFNAKMKIFDLPFIQSAPTEIKSAIRRAPDMTMLNVVLSHQINKHIEETGISFLDLFDLLEEQDNS